MKTSRLGLPQYLQCFARLGLSACALWLSLSAPAGELSVWSAGAAQAPLTVLVKEYQKSTGDRLKV